MNEPRFIGTAEVCELKIYSIDKSRLSKHEGTDVICKYVWKTFTRLQRFHLEQTPL